MNDLISKQAALDCFHEWVDKYGDVHTPDEMQEYCDIEALPCVNSEGKHGTWLVYPPDEPFGEWTGWKCSLCGNVTYEQNFDFCPYCGATMDEVEE